MAAGDKATCKKCSRGIHRDQDDRGWLHDDETVFTQTGTKAHVGAEQKVEEPAAPKREHPLHKRVG